jgi:xylono-1,5-lactonase
MSRRLRSSLRQMTRVAVPGTAIGSTQDGGEMSGEPSPVWDLKCELGEGPVWVDGVLWFVDIKGRAVHSYQPQTGARGTWSAPEPIGFLQPIESGGFVAGLKSGLHRFGQSNGTFTHLAHVEPPELDNRLNDGAVDAEGFLWCGSMHDPETNASGALYRLDQDNVCRAHDRGYIVTNGPTFSPDGQTLYHTDTIGRVIYAFDRLSDGSLANKRVFATIERPGAYPDGAVVDAEGCIWTGLFGGWGVERYAPSGELLRYIRFPCSRVTKIAFGGPGLQTIYATTAWKGLDRGAREREPLAGSLFELETDVPGLPAPKIRHGVS